MVGESRPVGSLVVLGTEGLEIVSVLGSFVVDLSNLLDFVVIDGEGSSFEDLVVKLFLGGGGLIWLLKADEGIKLLDTLSSWMQLETFDLSIHGEQISKSLLSDIFWESLDIKVASLL